MGLLDELRKEADSRKSAAEKEQERIERLNRVFREQISPRLLQAHRYFHELATQLELLNPDIWRTYTFPGYSEAVPLRQRSYSARGDTDHITKDTREAKLMFECAREAPLTFTLEHPVEIAKTENFFQEHGIVYSCHKLKGDRYEVVAAEFEVTPRFGAAAQFNADIDNACIQLYLVNIEGFTTRRITLRPEQLTEAMLDDLGNYLLHRTADFMKLEISDEARRKIQEQLAAARQQEDDALARAEEEARRLEAEQKESRRPNLFRRP